MPDDQPLKPEDLFFANTWEFLEEAARQAWEEQGQGPDPPLKYHLALGDVPIQLGIVEFRILRFLASRPYYAFTRRRIAEAVHTQRHPVTDESIDQHILSLRDQLGFFHDYVQTVPYIGYRFKA